MVPSSAITNVPPRIIETLVPFEVKEITELGAHASARQMWRAQGEGRSAILVYHSEIRENRAFVEFGKRFIALGISTPEVYGVSEDGLWYAQQDLGNTTLFSILAEDRAADGGISQEAMHWYRKAVAVLPQLQVRGGEVVDYSLCYPQHEFDRAGMNRDLEACKRDFLDRSEMSYLAEAFYADGQILLDWLETEKRDHFLHRDFQARNLMISDQCLWIIDYQNGRKGPLGYDLVSLLFQAQARLSHTQRETLLAEYLVNLKEYNTTDEMSFRGYFFGFAILRMIQVLGTYGREGIGGGKDYFLRGIPLALAELDRLLLNTELPVRLLKLQDLVRRLRDRYPIV
jgi:aminoglycoside/choline kinase family phosphotransferase